MIKILSLLLILSGCAYIIKKNEQLQTDSLVEKKVAKTYCEDDSQDSYASSHVLSHEAFLKFIQRLEKRKISLNFADRFILWSLFQMAVRPDMSSPSARFSAMIRYKGKETYWDFKARPKTDQTQEKLTLSFYYGLEKLSQVYQSRHSLLRLVELFDRYRQVDILVESDFNLFLVKNEPYLRKYTAFGSIYFKGEQLITRKESLSKIRIRKIHDIYRKIKGVGSYTYSNKLTEFKSDQLPPGTSLSCSFDMARYQAGQFLLEEDIPDSNSFSYQNAKGDYFLASTSQVVAETRPLLKTRFIKGSSQIRANDFCLFKKGNGGLAIFATHSRDPGQHLHQLFKYGPFEADSMAKVDQLFRFPRYIFLTSPVRLVFESQRGSQQQKDSLLHLNIPLYHQSKVGRFWGHYSDQDESGLIIDDRYEGRISCGQEVF